MRERDWSVEGDWHRLDQVLGNLVNNALRYTSEGGEIRLSAAGGGDSVLVKIQDSGEGIADEDLPFVFDRFWKGDKSRTRASGGSGLGWPSPVSWSQLMAGEISVESQEGEGTTFTIRLPAAG